MKALNKNLLKFFIFIQQDLTKLTEIYWLAKKFGFFSNILQKTPNEHFGQINDQIGYLYHVCSLCY